MTPACRRWVPALAIDTSSGAPPLNVSAIKNKNGRDIVVTGNIYGNRLLKVSSIQVTDPVLSGDTAEAKLKVVMERTNRAYTGEKTVTKDFELTLNLDTSANPPTLVGCATGGGELIAMCNALGGTWAGGNCALAPPPEPTIPDVSCGADKVLTGFSGGNPVCVEQASVASSSPGSENPCSAGEAWMGNNADGDVVCTRLSAGQATAPGVPPGCFPVKSELKRMAKAWRSGHEPTVKGSSPACPASYGVTRRLVSNCMYVGLRGSAGNVWHHTQANNYTCILSTFCCLN